MFSWMAFLVYAVITAVTPGPNNLMSLSEGTKKGFVKALPFNYGVFFGFTAVMFACTFFCSVLSAWIPKLMTPMLFIGAAYLLYLAWETYRSGEISGDEQATESSAEAFRKGAFLQFVNVKIYVYCIMSMEAFILPFYSDNPAALAGFALLLAVIGFLFTLVWSAFGSSFRVLFTKYTKPVNTVLSLLLVYCAASLFF